MLALPQHVHDLVRGIKMQNLVEGTQFNLMLSLSAILRLNKLIWAIDGFLGWFHYEYRTGIMQGVPIYRRHERECLQSNPVSQVGVWIGQ